MNLKNKNLKFNICKHINNLIILLRIIKYYDILKNVFDLQNCKF